MEENVKKLHIKCTDLIPLCIWLYAESINVFLSRSCPRH